MRKKFLVLLTLWLVLSGNVLAQAEEAVSDAKEEGNILYAIVGIGVFGLFLLLLMYGGMKRMKAGKISKHWQDY